MLLLTRQQLDKPLRDVVLQDEELAPMVVLPDVEAENVVEVAEDSVV